MACVRKGFNCAIIFLIVSFINPLVCQDSDDSNGKDKSNSIASFDPLVTATCAFGSGDLNVRVQTQEPFYGIIHSRLYRNVAETNSNGTTVEKPNRHCSVYGQGLTNTILKLNMYARKSDLDECGVTPVGGTEKTPPREYTVQVSVHLHHTLELAEDKSYVVTCGNNGGSAQGANAGSNTGLFASMGLYEAENNRGPLAEVYYGHRYRIVVRAGRPNSETGFVVRNCFSFPTLGTSGTNTSVALVDSRGCPAVAGIMSEFTMSNPNTQSATISSIFRFQDSTRLSMQCEIVVCKEDSSDCRLPTPDCTNEYSSNNIGQGTTTVLTSTTVSVLEKGDQSPNRELALLRGSVATAAFESEQCTGICPKWLLWLCIIFAVLFLLMLLVNLFLCSALTCTCTRTELVEQQDLEENPSLEDYDPYKSSYNWVNNGQGNNPASSIGASGHGNSHRVGLIASPSSNASHYGYSNRDYATVSHPGSEGHNPNRPGSRSYYSQNISGQQHLGGKY